MAAYFTDLVGLVAETATKVIDASDADRLVIFKMTAGELYVGFTEAEAEATTFNFATAGGQLTLPADVELWVWSPAANGIRLIVTKQPCGC